MKYILLVLVSAFAISANAATLKGTYQGTVHMAESNRTMNLKIFMNFVTGGGNDGQLTTIVGSFVIDDEGGPFAFSNIDFDINTGLIDFRYNRPNRSRNYNTPSHLRFTGATKIENEKFKISGDLISGIQGPLGTFEVAQVSEEPSASATQKYFGSWDGTANLDRSRRLTLNLAPSEVNVINPEYMELDFTNGKSGSFGFMTNDFFITVVYIDYLRGRMYLVDGSNPDSKIILESELDHSNGGLSGIWNSTYRGYTGTFQLNKVP